jgi:hypothetical protein
MTYALLLQVDLMLMGFCRQAELGLCKRAHHTDSAGRTTVGATLKEAVAT